MKVADLRPIETQYKGYRFRSRLEARWAVFFDALGVKWEYEPEGFELPGAGRYLPDFWLESVQMWAEVKPVPFSPQEKVKCGDLVLASGYPCILLDGTPFYRTYDVIERCWDVDGEWGCNQTHPHVTDYADVVMDEEYLSSEHRFFWMPCCCPRDVECCRAQVWPRAKAAYIAARSARFEHGEQGR